MLINSMCSRAHHIILKGQNPVSSLSSHPTAKPSGTAAQFHSTFRSGNPDNPTSIASHITVSSYTAALSQCHFRNIIQSIPHTLQHQEISTFRSVTHALVVLQQTHAVVLPLPISRCCLRSVLYKSESLCERGSDGEKEQQQRCAAVCALLLTG